MDSQVWDIRDKLSEKKMRFVPGTATGVNQFSFVVSILHFISNQQIKSTSKDKLILQLKNCLFEFWASNC